MLQRGFLVIWPPVSREFEGYWQELKKSLHLLELFLSKKKCFIRSGVAPGLTQLIFVSAARLTSYSPNLKQNKTKLSEV